MTHGIDNGSTLSTGADARWSPTGADIAGSMRPAWLPIAGLVAALALIAGFYGVVDGAVQRAERVHGSAGTATLEIPTQAVIRASL